MESNLSIAREALLGGLPQDAAAIFAARIAEAPSDHETRYWLASALTAMGDADGADQAMRDARILHGLAVARSVGADLQKLRSDPVYANDIATRLYAQGLVAVAAVVWEMALSAGHVDAMILTSYGLALQHQGRAEEAVTIFQAASDNFPSPTAHQWTVYAQLFREDGEQRYAAEARAWAAAWAQAPAPAPHKNGPASGRRLRIGYVAPSFVGTQIRQFITPVLKNHNPRKVDVFLYCNDAAAETGWPGWFKIRSLGQMPHADAAALIRRDGIDVLNDVWGHTAGSRLVTFAYKPAPVQAAWINFFHTTGLPQMDYVFHAQSDGPSGVEHLFNETLWPVGQVFSPFLPAEGRLPPAPTPARAAGEITFGSFNHPAKLSPVALAAWADLLRLKPNSRLLLKYRYFADPVLQRAIQAGFAARGVAPERVVFEGQSNGEDYFLSFHRVDLMLDAWPTPGSTTTLDALSNGVPVLAMVGAEPSMGGIYAQSILEAAGLPELVTTSAEAYIARALELTADLDRLDALRARVRPGFDRSAICDGPGFTEGLEAAYLAMFERWRTGA